MQRSNKTENNTVTTPYVQRVAYSTYNVMLYLLGYKNESPPAPDSGYKIETALEAVTRALRLGINDAEPTQAPPNSPVKPSMELSIIIPPREVYDDHEDNNQIMLVQ